MQITIQPFIGLHGPGAARAAKTKYERLSFGGWMSDGLISLQALRMIAVLMLGLPIDCYQ